MRKGYQRVCQTKTRAARRTEEMCALIRRADVMAALLAVSGLGFACIPQQRSRSSCETILRW